MIRLISPAIQHKEKVMDFRNEFITEGEDMHGGTWLLEQESYEQWLILLEEYKTPAVYNRGNVRGETYLGEREDGRIVGIINLRLELNEFLRDYGGHIGYSVRKSERRKGYAKEMLRLALIRYRELHIDRVLISCNKNNIASNRTIMALGGILENEINHEGELIQRYWITL